jgi:hypothetical protein
MTMDGGGLPVFRDIRIEIEAEACSSPDHCQPGRA